MGVKFTCAYCKEPLDKCACGGAVPEMRQSCEGCNEKDDTIGEKDDTIGEKDEKIEELMGVIRSLNQSPTSECTVVLRVDPDLMEVIRRLHDGKMP